MTNNNGNHHRDQYQGPERRSIEFSASGVRAKGYDLMTVVLMVFCGSLVWIGAEITAIKADAAQAQISRAATQAQMASAIKELAVSQHFLGCILAAGQNKDVIFGCSKIGMGTAQ